MSHESSAPVVLITGATTGIGRHMALHLAQRGMRVIATGRRPEALAKLASDAKGGLETLALDVTDRASIARAAERVDAMTGDRGLDVLVNNAGYAQYGPLDLVKDEDLRRQFETNVFGLLAVTRAFVPRMRVRRQGRIINIGSIAGRMSMPFGGAYHASKHAVAAINDALRAELNLFGIAVTLIEPGPIKSEFLGTSMSLLEPYLDVGSPYAPLFPDLGEVAAQMNRLSAGPEVVTRAVERAIRARRPPARTIVPFSSRLFVALLALLPRRWADALFMRSLGIRRRGAAAASPGEGHGTQAG